MSATQTAPVDFEALKELAPAAGLPFDLLKIGHIVLRVADVERSVKFYTQVLGFRVSDVYPEDMVPGGMVFMRCNRDHHGVALVGGIAERAAQRELHHFAFAVATLDEVFRARRHLRAHNVPIVFEGRRRAGVQIAIEFEDPDGHQLEIYWGLDQLGPNDLARPKSEWRWAHSLEEAIEYAPPGQNPTLADPSLVEKKA